MKCFSWLSCLKFINPFRCFYKQKSINRQQYVREIFDSLDADATNKLEVKELDIIWDIFRKQQISKLHQQIETLKNQDTSQLLEIYSKGKPLSNKIFKQVIKSLTLTDENIVELWKIAKKDELEHIQKQLTQ